MVYEICFVFGRGLLFWGLAGCDQIVHGVKPEFCYAIVRGWGFVSWDVYAVALDQFAEVGDASADGAVDVFPVAKEFFVG